MCPQYNLKKQYILHVDKNYRVKAQNAIRMGNKKKFLIVVAGPTAIGKTRISIQLAKRFKADVISADSRQIYRELNIGTAKIKMEEAEGIPHHFIDIKSIEENYSAGDYEKDVIEFLDTYFEDNSIAILTGGTGLYINAILNGLDEFPEVPKQVLDNLELEYNTDGLQSLQDEIKIKDPKFFAQSEIQNPRRLIRALSIIRHTGKTFTEFQAKKTNTRIFSHIPIVLELPRDQLYEKINTRVDKMMTDGLFNEVKSLLNYKENRALITVGYKELFDHLEGKMTLEQAISKIKQHSRNYAKRQITWFNNSFQGKHFSPNELSLIIEYVLSEMES